MSFHREVIVYCDGPEHKCPYHGDVALRGELGEGITNLRARARRWGWLCSADRDLCPKCRETLGIRSKPRGV